MSAAIIGLDVLLSKFAQLGASGVKTASAVIGAITDDIVADAKKSAPADLGKIRQGLGKELKITNAVITATVFSNAPESPFQEFGTGGKVDVPSEMADVAAGFRGQKGGSMAAFILALTGWVQRHGLTGVYSVKTQKRVGSKASNSDADKQAAWAIAKAILRDGLTPRPFLYPAYLKGKAKVVPQLENAYIQLLKNA